MTVTTAGSSILNATLVGFTWSPTIGAAATLTYGFLNPSAPNHGVVADFQAISAPDQLIVVQAMQTFSAVANVTFTQVADGLPANILFGASHQAATDALTYQSTRADPAPPGFLAFGAADVYFSNSAADDPVNFWLALHEMGNALGLQDFSGFPLSQDEALGLPAIQANFDYTVMANNYPAHGWAADPRGVSNDHSSAPCSQGPQLLDIQALQYLYGANQTGFTQANAHVTSAGVTYGFADGLAPECVWVGNQIPGRVTFDFSACTGPVTINLNAGAFSSTGVTTRGDAFVAPRGSGLSFIGAPYNNVSIAFGTVVSVGVANDRGALLIADTAAGHDDTLVGGSGNDTFTAGGGADTFMGGGGSDTAVFHDASTAYRIDSSGPGMAVVTEIGPGARDGVTVLAGGVTTLQFAERVVVTAPPSAAGQVLSGGAGDNTLTGGAGDDTITGGTGANYLRGGAGDDVIVGGAGFNDMNGNQGADTIHGGGGDNWVVGGQGNDLLFGGGGTNLILGNLGDDTLHAGAGDDVLRGGQGNDVIFGGRGKDFISGDLGHNTETGGTGADTFHSFSAVGQDVVTNFSEAKGDHVQLDPGTSYTVSQVGADTVIAMVGGGEVILQGVALASLHPGWILVG